MTDAPQRIRLSRKKGWRMPPNTVKVDRSTKWGNPFTGDLKLRAVYQGTVIHMSSMLPAVDAFRLWLEGRITVNFLYDRRMEILNGLEKLRGKNLACWCPETRIGCCHADVLLELANRPEAG